MRKTILAAACGLSLAFVAPAMADVAMSTLTPQPEQMAEPISATTNDSKEVVCHHLVHEGLLMREQVCLTKREWDRVRQQTQRAVTEFQVHSFSEPLR